MRFESRHIAIACKCAEMEEVLGGELSVKFVVNGHQAEGLSPRMKDVAWPGTDDDGWQMSVRQFVNDLFGRELGCEDAVRSAFLCRFHGLGREPSRILDQDRRPVGLAAQEVKNAGKEVPAVIGREVRND